MSAKAYWLTPIDKPHGHACLCCPPIKSLFPADGIIAVGFGYAACTRDGTEVLTEPQLQYDDDGVPLDDGEEEECPTGADAERLAAADPDHDWRIHLHGPLSGRVYQRQGDAGWVLVEQNEGFA